MWTTLTLCLLTCLMTNMALIPMKQCRKISSAGENSCYLRCVLKPEKCFHHIISFDLKRDEIWAYATNEEDEEIDIGVPMPDGLLA